MVDKQLNNLQKNIYNKVFEEALELYADNLEKYAPSAKYEVGQRVMVNIYSDRNWLGDAKTLLKEVNAPYGNEFYIRALEYDIDDIFDHPQLDNLKETLVSTYIAYEESGDLIYELEEKIKQFFKKHPVNIGWLYELGDAHKKLQIPDDVYFQEEILIAEKTKAGTTYKKLLSFIYEQKMLDSSLKTSSEPSKLSERIQLLQMDSTKLQKQLFQLI